jgi:uncharacterized protein YcbX
VAVRLAALTRYPIKSCRGIAVDRARVSRRGIEDDRRWMIVDPEGSFVTQREEARLALVDVALEGSALRLAAPEMPALEIPARLREGARREVVVWRSTVDAIPCAEAGAWMSRFLGRDVAVVYMPDDVRRELDPDFARAGDHVSFADGYPLLLASESSLDDLCARLPEPVPMSRFRPNVVVEGLAPWAEDERCVVVTIDPETAVAGKEPLRTLATFRRRDGKVLFGVNLIPDLADDATAELAVGDPIRVEPAAIV